MSEATYGDVTGEYLAARRECGLVVGDLELVWAEGADAVTFLDGLLSQDVAAVPPGGVARSLLLGPQGKLRALMWLLREEKRVGLLTEAGRAETIVSDLGRYLIRVDAELSPDAVPVSLLLGPRSGEVLAAAGLPVPDGWTTAGDEVVAAIPLNGLPRFAVAGVPDDRLIEAGAQRVGRIAATAVRVEAGEPRMDVDVDEKTIPQESGLVPETVSFTKGCYLGQELVARIDSRGHVNRHLRGIVIASNVLPPEGAQVMSGDRAVGNVTSVVESLTVGAPVGLALVRREVEPGDRVAVSWEGGRVEAEVRELPLAAFTLS